jgi:hypothetical protein
MVVTHAVENGKIPFGGRAYLEYGEEAEEGRRIHPRGSVCVGSSTYNIARGG